MKKLVSINILVIICIAISYVCLVSSESAVLIEINGVENAIIQGFEAIIIAEQNGVDITNPVKDLNEAIELLSKARKYYYREDYETALSLVTESKEKSFTVLEEVSALSFSVIEENEKIQLQNFILTRVLIIIALLSLFILWKRVKQSYMKKILRMKPTVESI